MRSRRLLLLILTLPCAACSTPGRGTAMHASPPAPTPTPAATSPAAPESPAAGVTIAPGAAQPFTDGAAFVTVESIDAAQPSAVFAVRCGRTVSANKVIPPGFYRVDLHNATFEITSNPADPAAGHVTDITFAQWVQQAASHKDWHVDVRPQGTLVSDGPTYDICTNANG